MSMHTAGPSRIATKAHGTPWPGTLVALCYLALATVLGGAIIVAAAPGLRAPMSVLMTACALAALGVGCLAWPAPAGDATPGSTGSAICLLAALLLPAPWAVVIAAAMTVAQLTWRRVSPAARLAAAARLIAMAALLTLLVHAVAGDAALLRAVAGVAAGAGSAALAPAAPAAVAGPRWGFLLVGLAVSSFLLDVLLSLVDAAIGQGGPLRGRPILRGATLVTNAATPALAVLAAAAYTAAPPVALLGLPALAALRAGLARAPRRHAEQEVAAAGSARQPSPAAREQEDRARLGALLAAVRAMGTSDDLDEVAGALVKVASGLTAFRSCTLYLYEPGQELFVPRTAGHAAGARPARAWLTLDEADHLMSPLNRLGYSYYTAAERDAALAPRRWWAGDMLLVPLLTPGGDVLGLLSLDLPADGQVPTADDLAPLEAVAALGAGMIARLRHTDHVRHMATTDPLTGLLNRRAFEERLNHELAAHAYRRPVALMMIDLDDFGAINNTYGHQAGDESLRILSGVIHAHLRQSDAAGRYGGDEFVVVLPGLDASSAAEVADRLRAALAEATTRAGADGSLPPIHTSIGVAAFPRDAADAQALIKAADTALYASKRGGKNRVSVQGAA